MIKRTGTATYYYSENFANWNVVQVLVRTTCK